MKKTRRNFIKLLIIKTLFLFSVTKSYSDHKLYSKKIIKKRIFKKLVWYLDKNDK